MAVRSSHAMASLTTDVSSRTDEAPRPVEQPGAGFRHVLVCLDRSAAAESVLPLATHLCRCEGARMTLLSVLESPPETDAMHPSDALEWDILRQEARSYLEPLADSARAGGIEIGVRVAEGTPARRVAAVAAEVGADLLVISTSGGGSDDGWKLGGTARKILTLARSPVLVVPVGEDVLPPHVPPRHILVPLDGSVRGECVLPTALRLARACDADVTVAHVVSGPMRTELLSTDEDLALAHTLADRIGTRAETYLDAIRAQLVVAGVRAKAAVSRSTDHREGIVSLAASEGADLLVLSAHGSVCNPRRRFGSVTVHVIEHSPVPVLVVQDLPDRPQSRRSEHPSSAPPSRLPPRSVDASRGGG